MKSKNKFEQLRESMGGFPQSNLLDEIKKDIEESSWRRNSQLTALRILMTLRVKKMTQNELAEKLGVSPQQVSKWVKGKENFTYETVGRIEKALGTTLIEIAKEDKKACAVLTIAHKQRYEDCISRMAVAETNIPYAANA